MFKIEIVSVQLSFHTLVSSVDIWVCYSYFLISVLCLFYRSTPPTTKLLFLHPFFLQPSTLWRSGPHHQDKVQVERCKKKRSELHFLLLCSKKSRAKKKRRTKSRWCFFFYIAPPTTLLQYPTTHRVEGQVKNAQKKKVQSRVKKMNLFFCFEKLQNKFVNFKKTSEEFLYLKTTCFSRNTKKKEFFIK